VKAASGTWPPFGNAEEDAIGPPPKALSEAIAEEPVEDDVVDDRLVDAAVNELVGPYNWFAADPPETKPEEPLELPALVRMNRSRRSKGFFR
jgi:hypothetical protein